MKGNERSTQQAQYQNFKKVSQIKNRGDEPVE